MPATAVRLHTCESVVVQLDGLSLLIERDGAGYRAKLFAGAAVLPFVNAWSQTLRPQRSPASWLPPCLWLGDDFCVDVPEKALQAIEDWSESLPPRRAVMRLADQPEALPIENAEAIAAAATAAHGAPCDVRC
jgi:hypothetical protein